MGSIGRAIGAVLGVAVLALSATSAEALVINPVFELQHHVPWQRIDGRIRLPRGCVAL